MQLLHFWATCHSHASGSLGLRTELWSLVILKPTSLIQLMESGGVEFLDWNAYNFLSINNFTGQVDYCNDINIKSTFFNFCELRFRYYIPFSDICICAICSMSIKLIYVISDHTCPMPLLFIANKCDSLIRFH